jgi:hypothetical protein
LVSQDRRRLFVIPCWKASTTDFCDYFLRKFRYYLTFYITNAKQNYDLDPLDPPKLDNLVGRKRRFSPMSEQTWLKQKESLYITAILRQELELNAKN